MIEKFIDLETGAKSGEYLVCASCSTVLTNLKIEMNKDIQKIDDI